MVLGRDLPLKILISSGYWSIFELINVRMQNWFYINLPSETEIRYLGYFFAYGTVIPAILVVREALKDFIEIRSERKKVQLKNYPFYAITIGALTFFLLLLYPSYFFPFAWLSPLLILDGTNYIFGYSSFYYEIKEGEYSNIVATLISGLICGFLWEFWNFWAVAKWVYTVPFFENYKVFEMPLAGYLGFAFFALGTVSFVNFLEGMRAKKGKEFLALFIALCLFTFPLIDRYTVFSYVAKIEDLYFLDKQKMEILKEKGVRTSIGVERSLLDQTEIERLELIHLKGLGLKNLKKLEKYGIGSCEKLSKLTEEDFSSIIGEKNKRRIRIYLKAARIKATSQERP